jgi:hypothetical protein
MSKVLTFRSTVPSLDPGYLSPVKNGTAGEPSSTGTDIQESKSETPFKPKSPTSPFLHLDVISCLFLQLLNLRLVRALQAYCARKLFIYRVDSLCIHGGRCYVSVS